MASKLAEANTSLPAVVSLKAVELRRRGYKSVQEWMSQPGHLYIGRYNKYLNLEASKWANPFLPKSFPEKSTRLEKYKEYIMNSQNLWNSLYELEVKVHE